MRNKLLIPRTRGLLLGLAILVLGAWGALVPFIGPWFHYSFIDHRAWSWHTIGRLWLEIIPGAAAFIAGAEIARTGNRVSAVLAGWLAAAAGAWFIVGQTVSTLWNHGASQAGRPLGSTLLRMIEQLGYFYALGAAILFLAGLALGRVSVVSARETLHAYSRRSDWREPEKGQPAEPTEVKPREREPIAS
jgi:hypothetical protein